MSWLPDWLTGYDAENARRAEAADAKLREMNAEDALAYGPTWLAQVEANYAAQDAAGRFNVEDQQEAIQDTFNTEMDAQAQKLIGGPLNAVGRAFWAMVKGVPVWVWIGGGVVIFIYFGGPALLRRKLAKS